MAEIEPDVVPSEDQFYCEHCRKNFADKPHATGDGYWLCDPCHDDLMNEPEQLKKVVHYTTLPGNVGRNSDPICLGWYGVSTDPDEVNCEHCKSIIRQRREMDLGDWLK